jgi:hypothetical protein
VSLDWWTESVGDARVPRESDDADLVSGKAWSDFAESVRQAGEQILPSVAPTCTSGVSTAPTPPTGDRRSRAT